MKNVILLICNIITGICAIVAIMISILVYLNGRKREMKKSTIKELIRIKKEYSDVYKFILTIPDEHLIKHDDFFKYIRSNKRFKLYLSEMEFFATGVNEKLYDVEIVNKMSGRKILSQFRKIKPYINDRQNSDSNNYSQYVKMIEDIKILRKEIEEKENVKK